MGGREQVSPKVCHTGPCHRYSDDDAHEDDLKDLLKVGSSTNKLGLDGRSVALLCGVSAACRLLYVVRAEAAAKTNVDTIDIVKEYVESLVSFARGQDPTGYDAASVPSARSERTQRQEGPPR